MEKSKKSFVASYRSPEDESSTWYWCCGKSWEVDLTEEVKAELIKASG